MKELGITKGEWQLRLFPDGDDFFVEAPNLNKPELRYGIEIMQEDFGTHNGYPREQRLADANLIADAGNTTQKCGLLPSELLRQRDELKEALIDMVNQFAYRGTYEGRENLHTGGLSALESAFDALGISDPITVLDFEAASKNTER